MIIPWYIFLSKFKNSFIFAEEEVVIFITNSVSIQMTNSVLSRNVLSPSRLDVLNFDICFLPNSDNLDK
jgi:hypothetical protein